MAVFQCVATLLPAIASDQSVVTELEEVVVEQLSNPEPELPLGIGIGGKTLKTAPGSAGDPLRSLQSLPGLVYSDDSSAAPAVRGSRPGDNYMEADFLPAGYLFHAGGVISVFNAELVESFNVYPSAYGPEFSGVTGGVFDMRLRDPKSDRFHLTLDTNILQAGFLVEGPVTEDQSFYFAGRFSYLDLFIKDQLEEDDGIEFAQFPRYTDYQGKYVWQATEDSTLRFQFNGATDEQDIIIAADSEEIDNEPIFAGRHTESARFNQQALVWDSTIGSNIAVKSALAHSNSKSDSKAGGAGQSYVSVNSWIAKSRANVPLNEEHEISVGISAVHDKASFDISFSDPACTEFEVDCSISGAEKRETSESVSINLVQMFVKESWFMTDRLTLFPAVALQSEDHLNKRFVEPRISLEYALRDDIILSAGAGIYHQMPDFAQIDKIFGNPGLDYLKAAHGVVGIQKYFLNGVDIKSELYYKKLDNLTTGDEVFRYSNDGEGVAYGIDTLIRKNMTDKFSGWVSLSLSAANRSHTKTGDSFKFEYDQPINLSVVGKYEFSSRWAIGAKFWLHSGALFTPIVGARPDEQVEGLFNPEFGDVNSKRFPVYKRLDVRIDRTFARANGKKLGAYFEVLNVLNNKNILSYDYNQNYSDRTEVAQLPRIIALGLRAEF